MDKKIAIVTWYKNLNYGGTLQAYALQKTLNHLGYDSEFINYCPHEKNVSYRVIRMLKDIACFCYKPKLYKSRKRIIKFIENKLKVSPPYYTYDQLMDSATERYSAAICGSDQIWANIEAKVEPLNYLTFISNNKRIAYAPSIGYNKIPDSIRDVFKQYVSEIRFLSVREQQGAKIIKEITGRDAEVVLDPSLLMTKEQWGAEIKQTKGVDIRGEYIFCYFLGRNSDYAEYANKLAEYTGYPVITLESKRNKMHGVAKKIADPLDFLYLMNNAAYILTDSFHGTAFSINLGKQFGVFKRFKDNDPICQNSRIYNILEKTCLESRLISAETPLSYFVKEIDYNMVESLLNIERKKSLEYLNGALNSVLNT